MPFPNWQGKTKVWTREHVDAALKAVMDELPGSLPTSDRAWGELKRGRYDLPPAARVYEYYHSFARAWISLGAVHGRITLKFSKWNEADDTYLLENAGKLTLESIAKHLGRSYPATRARLNKEFKIHSRHNQGYLSAAELAKEYNFPYHRIRDALAAGKIKGRYDRRRNRWQIDLSKLTPEAIAILKQPKLKSYRTTPPDVGDYYQRYGLIRTNRNGKVIAVERG